MPFKYSSAIEISVSSLPSLYVITVRVLFLLVATYFYPRPLHPRLLIPCSALLLSFPDPDPDPFLLLLIFWYTPCCLFCLRLFLFIPLLLLSLLRLLFLLLRLSPYFYFSTSCSFSSSFCRCCSCPPRPFFSTCSIYFAHDQTSFCLLSLSSSPLLPSCSFFPLVFPPQILSPLSCVSDSQSRSTFHLTFSSIFREPKTALAQETISGVTQVILDNATKTQLADMLEGNSTSEDVYVISL